MKILVTGSEGNIGSKLVPFLKKMNHTVYCVDIKQKYDDDYILSDITNPIDLLEIFNTFKPDVVFHLAAMVSRITCEKSPSLCVHTNITGTNNIIQLCKTFKSKLIYFSTSEIYGNIGGLLSENRSDIKPNNLYGLTKYLGEKLVEYEVENNQLDCIVVRPFMFYDEEETMGVHRSAMIRFAESLLKNKKIIVHKGSKRSWMHISDAVIILEKLIHVNDFHILNIGNEDVINMEVLAEKMCNYLGLEYNEYVEESELPSKMTLTKYPDTNKQYELTKHKCNISIDDGIDKLFTIMKNRVK